MTWSLSGARNDIPILREILIEFFDSDRPINVLDFGGRFGGLYKAIIEDHEDINSFIDKWSVVELEGLYNEAILNNYVEGKLEFYNSLQGIKGEYPVAVFRSSSMYLSDENLIKIYNDLVKNNQTEFIFISISDFHNGESVNTQLGGHEFYIKRSSESFIKGIVSKLDSSFNIYMDQTKEDKGGCFILRKIY